MEGSSSDEDYLSAEDELGGKGDAIDNVLIQANLEDLQSYSQTSGSSQINNKVGDLRDQLNTGSLPRPAVNSVTISSISANSISMLPLSSLPQPSHPLTEDTLVSSLPKIAPQSVDSLYVPPSSDTAPPSEGPLDIPPSFDTAPPSGSPLYVPPSSDTAPPSGSPLYVPPSSDTAPQSVDPSPSSDTATPYGSPLDVPPSSDTAPLSGSPLYVPPSSKDMLTPSLCEDTPIPPPRRKRKKKFEKQPSLENLCEENIVFPHPRSMTVSGYGDLKREIELPTKQSVSCPGHEHSGTAISADVSSKARSTTDEAESQTQSLAGKLDSEPNASSQSQPVTLETVIPTEGVSLHNGGQTHSQSRLSNPPLQDSRSRSATPTPAIAIEPDVGLRWTTHVLLTPESEVVTADTLLAKARGSNTTTSSVGFPSDDDSLEGDTIFGDDSVDEEGGADSEVGGDDEIHGHSPANEQSEHVPQTVQSDSDNAILESTMVTNLDTGEVIPLSAAEERIPQGHVWSPLSEHLRRRTRELAALQGRPSSLFEDDDTQQPRKSRKKAFMKLKWRKIRRDKMVDERMGPSDEAALTAEDKYSIKYKQSSHKPSTQEFDRVRLKQDLTGTHLGAIWSMEFSICGRLLATAGQDSVVRVWVLATAALFFHELQAQYQRLGVYSSVDSLSEKASVASSGSKSSEEDDSMSGKFPFQEQPLCSYYGHTADVLDLSWSKNFFLLSSSMDKTVRLWHISRKECLCCFQHVDFVTAIAFHPRDDRYFLSGSLDGKLRLWNIPDKRVALWNEIEGVGSHLITAANFCMNGKLAVVGTYDGRCIFYDTEHLKYHTQINVKSRHGKNKGRKISGVEPLPGEDKLLVTSNDSRIRLYNLKDHELSCKYKGYLNTSSQIKGTFSRDGQYIISGSEDNFIYVWKTHTDLSKLSSGRRDRNEFYESFSCHSAPVTTAVFAPVPGITVDEGLKEVGEMVVAADYQGCIKIYVSGEKL